MIRNANTAIPSEEPTLSVGSKSIEDSDLVGRDLSQASAPPRRAFGWRRLSFLLVLCALGASLASSSAFAQGCALCYEQAAQSGPRTARAIDLGILTLLLPTLLMFLGVLFFAFKRANSHR